MRPKKYTKQKLLLIKHKLLKYIKFTDIPIIAEFAYLNNLPRQMLYEHPELSDTIKKLIDKKESQLEILGLKSEINSTLAIFSLKQLGWRDKHETDVYNYDMTKMLKDPKAELFLQRIANGEDQKSVVIEYEQSAHTGTGNT